MTNTEISNANKIMIGSVEASALYIGSTKMWPIGGGQHDYSLDYFTIESLADSNTIKIAKAKSPADLSLSYSTDNGSTWTDLTITGGQDFTTINTGDKIIFKGVNDSLASAWDSYYRFNASKNFKAYGNVMSILWGDNFTSNSEFKSDTTHNLCGLFYGTTTLIDASNLILPALTCTSNCYNGAFRGCTNLIVAPQLPATQSAVSCYGSMFEGDINLEIAPEINLVNMSQESCMRMFLMNRNSKITTPKMTKSPILRCQTPAVDCYKEMFKGNGNINEVTCLITTSGISCTTNWLANAGNGSGTFRKSPLKSDWIIGSQGGVPTGWTIIDYVES